MLYCPSLIKMNELSRLYLLSDYICGVKAVFLCFYCFINPACMSEQFMIMSCRFLQEVISYDLTHVAYKTHRQKSRNTAIILFVGFFFFGIGYCSSLKISPPAVCFPLHLCRMLLLLSHPCHISSHS